MLPLVTPLNLSYSSMANERKVIEENLLLRKKILSKISAKIDYIFILYSSSNQVFKS